MVLCGAPGPWNAGSGNPRRRNYAIKAEQQTAVTAFSVEELTKEKLQRATLSASDMLSRRSANASTVTDSKNCARATAAGR